MLFSSTESRSDIISIKKDNIISKTIYVFQKANIPVLYFYNVTFKINGNTLYPDTMPQINSMIIDPNDNLPSLTDINILSSIMTSIDSI